MIFVPDYRNRGRQKYYSSPECQAASKQASQRRWLSKAANRDYFRDPENARHVRKWRQAHPGYWKKKTPVSESTQIAAPQAVNPVQSSCNVPRSPLGTLQDFCLAKDPGFIGLIAMGAILNGACLDVRESKLHYVVGTDGRCLFSANSFCFDLKKSVVIPDSKFLEWPDVLDEEPASLSVEPGQEAEPAKDGKPAQEATAGWVKLESGRWTFITYG